MAKDETSPSRIAASERQARAVAPRRAGVPYERIARELGYAGPSGAHKAVRSALRKAIEEPARELLQLDLVRLDEMLYALWQKVRTGDPRAVHTALAVMDHRAKLTGAYAPHKVDVEQRLRIMAEQEGLDPEEAIAEARRILRREGKP